MKTEHVEVHAGHPNIFAELGLPDAENHFLKAQIVAALHRLVKERKLNQAKAGTIMGITQPEVSRLFRGHFREYSVERLMSFLTAFSQDVEIIVRPHAKAGEAGNITFNAVMA